MEIPALTRARERYDQLQPREKKLFGIAAAVTFLLVAGTVVHQVQQSMDRLDKEAINGAQRLGKVRAMLTEYDAKFTLLKTVEPPEGEVQSGSLEQVLQDIATQAGAGDNVASMRNRPSAPGDPDYRETAVEAQLKSLPLEPLVKMLAAIDRHPSRLKVSRLRLDAHGDEGKRLFDASLTVSRFESAG